MYARAVEDAASELRQLRREEWASFGLAAVALALALVATMVEPALAIPLFLGGVFVALSGVRAVWRHWDLLDRLMGERDAFVISEVRARAEREATMASRKAHAAAVRDLRLELQLRAIRDLDSVVDELDDLASELEDEKLALNPASAVACARLLECGDGLASPEDLRSRIRRIRAGFTT